MNELLLSLLVSVLRQGSPLAGSGFAPYGPLGLPGGLATRPLPTRILVTPAAPRNWPVATSSLRDRALQRTTLAALYCLGQDGRVDTAQTRRLIDQQGMRQGWPAGWHRQIPAREVGRTIGGAGGCRPLLARLGGTATTRTPRQAFPTRPAPGAAGGGSRSEVEGFGLAPYR
jgi:hypothetical protein